MTEERKEEGQIVPEVEAAWRLLSQTHKELGGKIVSRQKEGVWASLGEMGTLSKILELESGVGMRAAFWKKVEIDIEFYLDLAKRQVVQRSISPAIAALELAIEKLTEYGVLLGQIPPEEELPEVPSAAEEVTAEVAVVEEAARTPLAELGLSTRVHNALVRGYRALRGDSTLMPCAEDLLDLGEDGLLEFRDFGPKALEELKTALRAHGFLPAEEAEED